MVGESKLAALYAEFAEEDRALAEAGLADYVAGLREEELLGDRAEEAALTPHESVEEES